jgi:hypothetical protein
MKKTIITTSTSLEEEAIEMEKRLKSLKVMMQEVKEADDALPRKGGARWKSARDDRGSVTQYAKDVTETTKLRPKVLADTKPAGVVNEIKKVGAKNTSNVSEGFQVREVVKWTAQDVAQWLQHIGLGEYASIFLENRIDGAVLVEISLDDLDYMKITILGTVSTTISILVFLILC